MCKRVRGIESKVWRGCRIGAAGPRVAGLLAEDPGSAIARVACSVAVRRFGSPRSRVTDRDVRWHPRGADPSRLPAADPVIGAPVRWVACHPCGLMHDDQDKLGRCASEAVRRSDQGNPRKPISGVRGRPAVIDRPGKYQAVASLEPPTGPWFRAVVRGGNEPVRRGHSSLGRWSPGSKLAALLSLSDREKHLARPT